MPFLVFFLFLFALTPSLVTTAVVASLGPGECDLVLSHTLPMAMGDPSTILDGKWETLSLCLIPGLIDKLPQLFLILVRSINVLESKQDGNLGDHHA